MKIATSKERLQALLDYYGYTQSYFCKRTGITTSMHQLGYTDKQIQAFGGWKTDGVMKTVYQHEMEMEKAKASMSNNFGTLIDNKKTG